jgi:biopolymer transport protein ExbD
MLERPPKRRPSIGLTPLIDIVFILLIFVILAANFDRIKGLKVDLPQSSATNKPPPRSLVLTITAKGRYVLDKKTVPEPQLFSTLQRLNKTHKILLLRADGKAAFAKAVKALDFAKKIGFEAVSIATQQGSAP